MAAIVLGVAKAVAEEARRGVWAASREADAYAKGLPDTQAGRILTIVALAYLGIALLRAAWAVARFIFIYFLRPGRNLKFYGSWAMVTGATDGIGKAYSVELAKRGLNLIVVSRTQAKLDALAAELEAAHGVQVRTVAADLTKLDAAALEAVAAAAAGLDVGILVNSAGMSYDHPEYLEQTSAAGNADLIAINAVAPTLLAQRLLLGMKERGRGAIVNIGSFNGALPAVPLLAAYAGSKAYVGAFTRALDAEARAFGVSVHDQCPMFVATKMSKIRRARLDAPTPAAWARAAVRQIGYDAVLTPWWYHGLMNGVVALAPRFLVVKYIRDLHLSFRARYYKKLEREAAAAAAGAAAEPKKAR